MFSDISQVQVSKLFVYMLSLGYRSRTWKMFEIFLGHKNDTFPGPKTKQAAARISYQFQDSNPEPLISWALPVPLWHSVRAEEQCTLVFIPLYTQPGAWARRVDLDPSLLQSTSLLISCGRIFSSSITLQHMPLYPKISLHIPTYPVDIPIYPYLYWDIPTYTGITRCLK